MAADTQISLFSFIGSYAFHLSAAYYVPLKYLVELAIKLYAPKLYRSVIF